ncbi:hypothetical protein CL617_03785 [archaeon]|nr:hypothetical protein [archaeon]|tara:strand:+ start:38123 stop:38893 length:771 start_codon:yes stop_codon:yes gene_type:complete
MFDSKKRGQVTIFIILGIIIVAIIGVAYFLINQSAKDIRQDAKYDDSKLQPLKDYVESCIKFHGTEVINLLGRQGGSVDPGLYQYYFDSKVSYLCHTDSFTACFNRKPNLIGHMENEIKSYLENNLRFCIDFQQVKEFGYNIDASDELTVSVSIGDANTIVNLDYPITIKKENTIIKENRFSETFNVPLGRLAEVALDGVEEEINVGDFFTMPYMLRNRGEVEIERQAVRGSKVYILNLRDNPYSFQYATRSFVEE